MFNYEINFELLSVIKNNSVITRVDCMLKKFYVTFSIFMLKNLNGNLETLTLIEKIKSKLNIDAINGFST